MKNNCTYYNMGVTGFLQVVCKMLFLASGNEYNTVLILQYAHLKLATISYIQAVYTVFCVNAAYVSIALSTAFFVYHMTIHVVAKCPANQIMCGGV